MTAPLAGGAPPRVTIIQPPLLLSREFIDTPYFTSLGAYQAAAVLRGGGLTVRVLDGFTGPDAELLAGQGSCWLGEPCRSYLRRLGDCAGELIVINASPFLIGVPGRRWLKALVEALARVRPSLLVLAELYTGGMHHLDIDPRRYLPDLPGVDLILRYEGEKLLERLVRAVRGGSLPRGEVWENREAFSLDHLPPPAWDLLDTEAYFSFLARVLGSPWRPGPMAGQPERTLPLITSRGCPYGCIFCTRNPGLPDPRQQVRTIPLQRIEKWLAGWVISLGLKRVAILDEIPNLESERFTALLTTLERLGLRVDFPNGLRADRLTRAQIQQLRRLTPQLKVSLESGCWRVQEELLGKSLDPAAVEVVAAWCREAQLPLEIHAMVGIPGETKRDIRKTMEVASQLHERHGVGVLLQYATPLPGSELARRCEQQELLVDAGEDLSGAFQGRGVIRTDSFDPDLLTQVRAVLTRRITVQRHRKVIVNLTYRCNNHCLFCAVGDRPRHDADLDEVLHDLRRYRRRGFELLDIDGGEPTLHPQLPRLISQARLLGFKRIALITNARRLSYPAYAQELTRAGLSEVLISLHAADPALNARLTGDPESFQQTLRGLDQMLRAMPEIRQVAVNTTLTAENLPSLGDLAELLAGRGVVRWNLQVVTPFGRAHAGLVPTESSLREQLGNQLAAALSGMQIQVINCPPCLLPGYESLTMVDFDKAGREMVFVGERGENLQSFLSHKRRHTPRCEECLQTLVCAGEYVFP